MKDLIEALNIFSKYTDEQYPTWCEDDVMHVNVDPLEVSETDVQKLEDLGFIGDVDNDDFKSFKFGSVHFRLGV